VRLHEYGDLELRDLEPPLFLYFARVGFNTERTRNHRQGYSIYRPLILLHIPDRKLGFNANLKDLCKTLLQSGFICIMCCLFYRCLLPFYKCYIMHVCSTLELRVFLIVRIPFLYCRYSRKRLLKMKTSSTRGSSQGNGYMS